MDLAASTEKFFTSLYQKMFQVMNSQYDLDDTYLECVGAHMKELQPFGEVPQKVKRSRT